MFDHLLLIQPEEESIILQTAQGNDIPNDIGFGAGFIYRQAMNFAWELQFANTQSLRLDQNWRNGWSWNVRWHFLY